MRNLSRPVLLTLALLALLAAASAAQITITANDWRASHKAGVSLTGYTTPLGTPQTVSVGTASAAAQIWDFSGLPYEVRTQGLSFIEPSTAPHIAQFPQANLVRKGRYVGDQDDFYQYNRIADDSYLLYGTGYAADSPYVYTPPAKQVVFPATYGSSWEWVADEYSPSVGITMKQRIQYTVDAHGTMKLPQGSYQALRIKTVSVTEMVSSVFNYVRRTVSYNFGTTSCAGFYVMIDTLEEGKATITAQSAGYEIEGSASAAEAPAAAGVLLRSYPNPCRDYATIDLTLRAGGDYALRLHDALGRAVWTHACSLAPGTHSFTLPTGDLRQGSYFFHVSTSQEQAGTTLRMEVVK